MTNKPRLETPARRLLVYFVILIISAVLIFASAATSQKQSGVPSPATQANANQEKLPDKDFTRPPEKPHDPTAFVFSFDQLEYYYRVPGEFTHRLNGDQYGFESLSFIISETHPGGGPGLHVHDTEEAHVLWKAPLNTGSATRRLLFKRLTWPECRQVCSTHSSTPATNRST